MKLLRVFFELRVLIKPAKREALSGAGKGEGHE